MCRFLLQLSSFQAHLTWLDIFHHISLHCSGSSTSSSQRLLVVMFNGWGWMPAPWAQRSTTGPKKKLQSCHARVVARVVAWVKNPDPSHIRNSRYIYIIYIYIYMVGKPKSAGSWNLQWFAKALVYRCLYYSILFQPLSCWVSIVTCTILASALRWGGGQETASAPALWGRAETCAEVLRCSTWDNEIHWNLLGFHRVYMDLPFERF